MPKVKTFISICLIIGLAVLFSGCGLLADSNPVAEVPAIPNGEVPGWLLLSHRNEGREEPEAEEVLNPKDPAEEEEEEIASPAPAQSTTEQPAPSAPQAPAPAPAAPNEPPKPGTREYMAWFAVNGATGTYSNTYLQWYNATNGGLTQSYDAWLKAEEEKDTAGGWFDGFGKTSPSGFNHDSTSR